MISSGKLSRSTTLNPEKGQTLALRALKAVSKSTAASLQYDEIPSELLFGNHVDLHRWTMILTDKNLIELGEQKNSGKTYFLDCSQGSIPEMFQTFSAPLSVPNGLVTLNIVGAKNITDHGLSAVARNSPYLKELNIAGCSQITDTGLREVGMNCTYLQSLNISSCYEMDGSGLSAIAECCQHLVKLDVSKCHSLKNWSLTKIFYKCNNLEELNVSHLKDVSDEEIRVLAQNCPHFSKLSAVECQYISDQGILILSQHCHDLDCIDVTRTQMTYRITDVSLLALAQRVHSLKTLKVNGCDHLSDVGVTWLTEGCKVIEELDLGGCTKISDAGLRGIGNECHALKSINISNCKLVTDVGISSLSHGCSQLKTLICHGVFLLADPRLSAPTKGAKLEAWQTVIGMAALANNCENIENLDISNCFRLNIALYQYVSMFSHLRVLNMSGCNQSSSDAIDAIAKNCSNLEELNLSDCGKSVNNKSMVNFGKNCKMLRVVILCRCTSVGGTAIQSISNCPKLEKLDLNGCSKLQDSMLISLCEINRVPKLHYLNISNCTNLTDSVLAWISMKSHEILYLALKNTPISKKAMMSVRDRFPNSDMLVNDNFYGFWPKHRVEDRLLMNKFYGLTNGITKVQARLRAGLARIRVMNIQEERRRDAARLLIQRVVRGFMSRKRTDKKRQRIVQMNRYSTLITTVFYIARARKKVLRQRQYWEMRKQNEAAVKLQVRWRIFLAKCELDQLRIEWENYLQRCEYGALKMQTVVRLYFANLKIKHMKELEKMKFEVRNRKSIIIQRCYRGFISRRTAYFYMVVQKELEAKRKKAASKIQHKFRCTRTREYVRMKVEYREYYMYCVVKVQALMRGALSRIHTAEIQTELFELRRHKSAVLIQAHARIMLARWELLRRVRERIRIREARNAAANMILRQARVKIAIIRINRRRKEHLENLRRQAQLEIDSAIQIQRIARGVIHRRIFKDKLMEKKGKWKELFDEERGKRFFYNKLTGEIRWRMPQDLLDLIPHPVCDNCGELYAVVECQDCAELFCDNCWQQVHYGGRRKAHNFRALYDYYGKRLDYGDGVFPCKWPTEVQQDKVQGWMLRVAPARQPARSYKSGWEEYHEHTPQPEGIYTEFDPENITQFYFNRETFEGTYEVPPEVLLEKQEEERRNKQLMLQQGGYYDIGGNWIYDSESDMGTWDGSFNYENGNNALVPFEESNQATEYDYNSGDGYQYQIEDNHNI